MRYVLAIALWTALCCGSAVTTASPDASATSQVIRIERCVQSRGIARYRGVGYDHIVIVDNGCDVPVACAVATNVDPKPIGVTVGAHRSQRVITRRGSPARAFKPKVTCQAAS